MTRAYYQASIDTFLEAREELILGDLAAAHGFDLNLLQRNAWQGQTECLKLALSGLERGTLLLEFAIPRMGKRADAVLVIDDKIIILEFKVGTTTYEQSAAEQVHDYALDLKNFHAGSHHVKIIPIVVATAAPKPGPQSLRFANDDVAAPLLSNAAHLPDLLKALTASTSGLSIRLDEWLASNYRPTPTIIEAARALYEQHGVEEIARSDAGAKNLFATTQAIQEVIDAAKLNSFKAICFVTGVPGAGKTLAGLNIATKRADEHKDENAVFLSGNGPLVIVLQEALARDKAKRDGISKKDAKRAVKSFVQPIHHFRDEYIRDLSAPNEKVVVFDEAQRAWTRDKAVNFMRKRGNKDFNASEPDFLVGVMDRHTNWCVIVCLVGGGQEINTGEAGLGEWYSAIAAKFNDWKIYTSDRLTDSEYTALSEGQCKLVGDVTINPDLHLSVSMRSFRAEELSKVAGYILDNEPEAARQSYTNIRERYPIFVTRDIHRAKRWLSNTALAAF